MAPLLQVSSIFALLLVESANGFQVQPRSSVFDSSTSLLSKKGADDAAQQQAFAVGTFIEFEEKSRDHIGKILKQELKSSGGARYQVIDSDGKQFYIPDKAVSFAINPPNSPGAASKLFDEFLSAHDASEDAIQTKLEISPELLEIAWEESNENEDHVMTPAALVEVIHSHGASTIEKYMAWKLLRTDLAHVFFKEIKDHGRVVSFKAKTRKAVEAAKRTFCISHDDNELCLV